MSASASMLSLAACAIYSVVLIACFAAASAARRTRQTPDHFKTWMVLALMFAAFLALRLWGAEEWLKDIWRTSLRAGGEYEDRRDFQAPLVAAILAITGAGTLGLLTSWTRKLRGRRNFARAAGIAAALAMVALVALRLASLHAFDVLLYGALKLNWIIDLGASLVVIASAIIYTRIVSESL